jgi:hypothetical protein
VPPTLTRRNKIGLVIAGLLALGDCASVFAPTPDGEVGPPLAVIILGGVLGLLTLGALVRAWRSTSRTALRVVAGTRVVSAILALPAFFVDIPPGLAAAAAASVALTVLSVVLILAPAGRPAPVTD